MPFLVDIPLAQFEITIEYARPNMRLLLDRAKVVDRLFEVFSEWQIHIDNIEVITDGKPSVQGIKFKIPAKRLSFMLGAGSCTLSRDDVDWSLAEETIKILDCAYSIVREVGGIETGRFKTNIVMHLQPKAAKFIDILAPFAPSKLVGLDAAPLRAVAAVVKWEKRRVTIDGSSQLANGVFVRMEREFPPEASYDEIAAQLMADETHLFEMLDVKDDKA